MRGKALFEPPRFMTVSQAVEQLEEVEKAEGAGCFAGEVKLVGVARVGKENQTIVFGSVNEFLERREEVEERLGGPLHSLVVCAEELHEMEEQFLKAFRLNA
jgi:diphthine synthase